ncbi:MAG TPA: peptidoglycan bridge formation glycyltransferase FemA/FemB family protein [Ktedonobacterales bacterium]|nr:peptidoglycan bridge formation glycyltransferase FemA/FemB family protein [Ktedonobacterales bacterium]
MEARLIEDHRQWNEFIASAATGHLCQTYEWADHSDEGSRAGSLRVGVLDESGRLVAAMLLSASKASGVPAPFYYAPRGPVCDDPASPALPLLIRAARREARKRGGFFIRIEPNIPQEDARWPAALRRLGFRPTDHVIYLRGAWVTDLRPDEDARLAAMMTTWRQNIRAGGRKGVTVRVGAGEADLDAFYRLLKETGERDQFYVYPKDLYRDMLAHYSAEAAARDGTAQMALLIAENAEGEAIAASTVAVLGAWAWNLHSGSSGVPAHRKLRPNYLLQWECMRWCKAHGAENYDWRTIPDILEPGQELYGVYEFKRGFGGAVRRVIPTMDLPLRPTLYWPYTMAVSLRRSLRHRRRQRFEARRERERQAREQAPGAANDPAKASL